MSIKCLPLGKETIAVGPAATASALAYISSSVALITETTLSFTL